MNNFPVVSVCMITYNHELYIREAIEGVLMQKTDFPIELIISEDCSTDKTRDIVKEYAEKYPDIIIADLPDKNRGMNVNAFHNKKLARGKYLAICEGDDYWIDPLKLQKQVDIMESNKEYSACCTDYYKYFQNTGSILPYSLTDKHKITTADLIKRNTVATLTTLIRREYLQEYSDIVIPTMPQFPMADYPMWIWISTKGSIYRINEKTAVYRVLEESASHSQDIYKKFQFMIGGYDVKIYFNSLLKLRYRFCHLKKAKAVLVFCIKNKNYRLLFDNIFKI